MGKPARGRGRGGEAADFTAEQKAAYLRKLRESESGREVFLRPLPLEVTVEDVQSLLAGDGGQESFVTDRVKLLNKGGGGMMSAFIILSSPEEAIRCTARLNGAKFQGHMLAASMARAREGVGRVREPCMFFLEGKCDRGGNCQFSHEGKPGKLPALGSRRLPICRFFASGGCSRGEDCKFSHAVQEDAEQQTGVSVAPDEEEAAVVATGKSKKKRKADACLEVAAQEEHEPKKVKQAQRMSKKGSGEEAVIQHDVEPKQDEKPKKNKQVAEADLPAVDEGTSKKKRRKACKEQQDAPAARAMPSVKPRKKLKAKTKRSGLRPTEEAKTDEPQSLGSG
eukprot:TRINITY_DN73216_c0_g1_i1.p1 TRINITY_DN73216_c0_g1~~TRINITY_DN73216_c0_g1_i1.p1  ORF type:complete len:338 (-),score=94.11 TRINITY_DN73216_c0_g1_i1:46-1059(-)